MQRYLVAGCPLRRQDTASDATKGSSHCIQRTLCGNYQKQDDLILQFFANHITALTVFFDSHFADEGNVYFGKLENLATQG